MSYKYIFVILVYRNTQDLLECIGSIRTNVNSYKIIVVNAYYDEATRLKCEEIALSNDCDFLNFENKGYSFGNNRGIEYALKNHDFQYLVIANPDTEIVNFDDKALDSQKYDIFAPSIITLRGTAQNPMGIKKCRLLNRILYKGFVKNNKYYVYGSIAINKILSSSRKFLNRIRNRYIYQIYCAHGSFVIMRNDALKKLVPVYDENMFLFAEEGVLASKAASAGLKTCFYSPIQVRHKEDGSMKLSNFSINTMLRDANIYYYEHYEK